MPFIPIWCLKIFTLWKKVNILFELSNYFANFAPYFIYETMKKLLFGLVILCFFASCGRQIVTEELMEADSLIAAEKNDSAYQLLSEIRERYLVNDEDRAHYYLLITRAAILTGNTVPPDSCIDYAIKYYEQRENSRSLADAYYYKGYSLYMRNKYDEALLLFKEAEEWAEKSNDAWQQFKISEIITVINEISGNNNINLKYARQSLKLAEMLNDNNRLAYSYLNLCHAFIYNEQEDSASYYIRKVIPYLDDVREEDMPLFLTEIGNSYKYTEPDKAKKYYLKALEYKDMTHTLAHLADIFDEEGNREEAYRLWKRALQTADGAPQDIIIYNILEYDIQHGQLDDMMEKVNDIIDINDSIRTKLKNDTLKDLQLRFDHEVEKHELDQQLNRSLWTIACLIALVIAFIIYVLFKRYKQRLLWTQTQIQIDYYTAQIRRYEESGNDVKEKVKELQAKIDAILKDNSQKLNRGQKLYNDIINNESMIRWSKEDYELFIDYFDVINHPIVKKLRKEHHKLTPRTLAFLLLCSMGKSDEDIRQIMVLSPEGLRSIRFRLSHESDGI